MNKSPENSVNQAAGNARKGRTQRKRKPSPYQKQIRFLTVLSVLVVILILLAVLWGVNHSR
jgi:hypothetical protein